ncbi:MAG TPA: HAD family phosphatase [Candidatus Dormibacteraeota bacterium]|nr:HAD family phosphatase [Candidatus Dormibacteraeota bacterium]
MTRGAPRAVLWDMDGTLVDSGDLHFAAWREIMRGLGRELTRAEFDATFGQRNDAILRRLVDPGIGDAEIAGIGDEKEARYRTLVAAQGIHPLAGALAWLRRLDGAGWRQAIASSGPRANAEAIVDALGLHGAFAAVAAAEDVTHGKPHPEVFLVAAARLGVEPARCIVVEDAPPGLEAGRRAGMPTIGVLSTHARLEADRVVAALTDLEDDAFERMIRD